MRGLGHILGGYTRQERRDAHLADSDSRRRTLEGRHDLPYPPVDPGIPAASVDEVLGVHQELIDRIRICYGVDRVTFENELLALIRRYAGFVHLLPATPDNYFSAPGGLLRMGLEVAFFSLQGTDGHIFSGRSTITTRRQLEPRWRYATFIAGLCCEIHRTLSHTIVTDDNGEEWQPYLLPLSRWLDQHESARFFVKWLPNVRESRALGVFALPHVVRPEVLQYLARGNSVIVPHMMASISGMPFYREHNILDELVRRSAALVIDRYLQASADGCGKQQSGSHLERYLVDALRRLVAGNPTWTPNADKSRVWFAADGLFIVWPNAAVEIRDLLESDQLPGIPKAPETILEILMSAGVVEPQDSSQVTWRIVPPGGSVSIEAVKLASPALLFAGIDTPPAPLASPLVRGPDPTRRATSQPAASDLESGAPVVVSPPASPQMALPIKTEATEKGAPTLDASPGHDVMPATAAAHEPPDPAVAPTPQFKLEAPLRLNAAVREALAQIVETLNADGSAVAACTVSAGVFIPLAEFDRRKIEPSLAVRALDDVKMLVQPAGTSSRTVAREFGGEHKVGLVLSPRFVAGLDAAHFNVPDV